VTYPFLHLDGNSAGTVSKEFQKSLNGKLTRRCAHCGTKLVKSTTFSNDSPPVVILSLLNAKLKKIRRLQSSHLQKTSKHHTVQVERGGVPWLISFHSKNN